MIESENLVRQMKEEKFDIGITELFDFSGLAFFEVIGLKNVIGAHTTSVFEGTLLATGAPLLPSFVPGSQTFTDDSGSLISRLENLYMTYWSYQFQNKIQEFAQKALDEHYGKGKAPKVWVGERGVCGNVTCSLLQNLVKNITWFFVNSDPIFDFPKPLPHNIVEIAGISVPKIQPLGEKWNEILNKRQKNVLVSFGSIASPTTMPEAVKKSIVETFAAFPDVTFIWKYDDTESHLTDHLNNVHIVKWMPQNDLLGQWSIHFTGNHKIWCSWPTNYNVLDARWNGKFDGECSEGCSTGSRADIRWSDEECTDCETTRHSCYLWQDGAYQYEETHQFASRSHREPGIQELGTSSRSDPGHG